MSAALSTLVDEVAGALIGRGEKIATAESCTGGLIAKVLTDVAGSSVWFERGVVSYSNEAKQDLLGVPAATLAQHGAVSEEVALAMAQGLVTRSRAHWTLAVTGIAGPGGGSAAKPVGTVWIAWAGSGALPMARRFNFDGSRDDIRTHSAQAALEGLLDRLRRGR